MEKSFLSPLQVTKKLNEKEPRNTPSGESNERKTKKYVFFRIA